METPLIDKIKEALADMPNAQVIVEGFRNDWKIEIEDAFLAGQQNWCDDHICVNMEEYLKNHFDIEI